jgi:hypothetical protein
MRSVLRVAANVRLSDSVRTQALLVTSCAASPNLFFFFLDEESFTEPLGSRRRYLRSPSGA